MIRRVFSVGSAAVAALYGFAACSGQQVTGGGDAGDDASDAPRAAERTFFVNMMKVSCMTP
jgi:hypothetical protein